MSAVSPGTYCPRCGDAAGDHPNCREQLAYEPPRFCAACGRRLVVQVTPGGWMARCSQHGEMTS